MNIYIYIYNNSCVAGPGHGPRRGLAAHLSIEI